MNDLVPITPAGAAKMKEELDRLRKVERPAVMRAIEAARELGDISDSGDYRSAKERQGWVEGRIRDLESKVSRLQIIDPAKLCGSRVSFGARVTIADGDTGDESTYVIVGDYEADVKAGRLSVGSPLARALIGREKGDTVKVRAPKGEREVEIVKIKFGA
ncbi:MAG: transcription elongation factor GreA [Myxococcota bacterium]